MELNISQVALIVLVAALSYLLLARRHANEGAKERHDNPAKPALFVLHEKKPSGNGHAIDIIAVHGLGSKAKYAWSYKTGSRSVKWLADDDMLPSTLSHFKPRILLYSYDSKWHQDAPIVRLQECGTELFRAIHDFRSRNSDSQHRPILFIGHSLGGNVIINGLVNHQNGDLKYLIDLTVGVVLLGSPLRGSGMAWLTRLVAWIMSPRGSHLGIIQQLDHGNASLRDTLIGFQRLSKEISMPSYCFYEKKHTDYGAKYGMPGLIRGMVVDEESACIDNHRHGLDSDHLGLNKYSSPEDPSFVRVSQEIAQICKKAKDLLKQRKNSPKAHFMVRFNRNIHFTGRETIMEQLSPKLLSTTTNLEYQRTALVGLGGIGKTQIALEAAWRVHKEDPECSIFWVSAVDSTNFDNGYRDIGKLLKIDSIEKEGADVKSLVQKALSKAETGRWLLVIDNADDSDLFFKQPLPLDRSTSSSLASCLPSTQLGCILFTTRDLKAATKLTKGNASIIHVHEMEPIESRQLLTRSLLEPSGDVNANVDKLLELLAHLPLAIKQAAAFMVENTMSVPRYLELFQSTEKKKVKLLGEDFEAEARYDNIDNAVMTTWLVSFDQISKKDKLAAEYLKLMSLMSEKDIPRGFLYTAFDYDATQMNEDQKVETEWLNEVDDVQVEKSIGTLAAYAFITKTTTEDSYDMHRLVSLSMRNWLQKENVATMYATQVVLCLNKIMPAPDYRNSSFWLRYLPHTRLICSSAINPKGDAAKEQLLRNVAEAFLLSGNYEESKKYIKQALEMSKMMFGNKHLDTLRNMSNLATVLSAQGKYDDADKMNRQTLELMERVLGKEHPVTLISMGNLADVLKAQGKYDEAEKMLRQTLELMNRVLGKEHPNTLANMGNLAGVVDRQGKYDEAEKMHRQTLKLTEKVLGKEHPDTLVTINNLAGVLDRQGKYDEAEKMHRQTLKLMEKVLGKEHPDTFISINNLAGVLKAQGKYDEAEKMLRQTLKVVEKVLGKEHPHTLTSMGHLASVLDGQGKYDEDEKMHRQTLKLMEKVLGEEHPDTLISMGNLAGVLDRQGKYDEAEKMHRQTVQMKEKVLGKEHPGTLTSMDNLAGVLDRQGKYDEAEKMHRQTLKFMEKVLGKEHPVTLISMGNVAGVLDRQGKYNEAEKMHRQTLELMDKVLGKEHPSTLANMGNLSGVLDRQGKYDEAEKMHRQTLQMKEKVLGNEHPDTLISINNLAGVLKAQGKYDEAEKMLRQTLELMNRVLGKEHPNTLANMGNLAGVVDRQGKYDEAEKMHRQTLKLTEKVLGKEHPDTLVTINNLAGVLDRQGKYDEAEKMHRQTLKLMEKVLGKEHPDTLVTINNLAGVLKAQGKYDEAEKMLRQTTKVVEKVLGKEHPDTFISLNNLVGVLKAQGKYDEAEKMLRQTPKAVEKVLGQEHPGDEGSRESAWKRASSHTY